MKKHKELGKILSAAKKNEFVSFTYTKETGEKSQRTVRFGGSIAKRMEKQGTPINGRGNWASGYGKGLRSMIIERNSQIYVRGTDLTGRAGHKIFLLSGISDVKSGGAAE